MAVPRLRGGAKGAARRSGVAGAGSADPEGQPLKAGPRDARLGGPYAKAILVQCQNAARPVRSGGERGPVRAPRPRLDSPAGRLPAAGGGADVPLCPAPSPLKPTQTLFLVVDLTEVAPSALRAGAGAGAGRAETAYSASLLCLSAPPAPAAAPPRHRAAPPPGQACAPGARRAAGEGRCRAWPSRSAGAAGRPSAAPAASRAGGAGVGGWRRPKGTSPRQGT